MAVENLTLAPFYGTQRNPYNYAKIEQISRDIVTSWLDIATIREQLNLLEDDSQDNYLYGLELATRMAIEDFLGMAIFPTQWRTYYANPGLYNTALFLDLPEVSQGLTGITINKIEYYGNTLSPLPITLAPANYLYDPTGNRVIVKGMPDTLSQTVANPIIVTYTQNANPISQYPVVQQAGLLLLTHLYNNRSNTTEAIMHELPFGVSQLLRPYKPLVM